MLENTLDVFKNKCPSVLSQEAKQPGIPHATWVPTYPSWFSFWRVQSYGYKDPYTWAAIPKPGEDKRDKYSEFQISKVRFINYSDYSLQAYYVPDTLYMMQSSHLILTTAA